MTTPFPIGTRVMWQGFKGTVVSADHKEFLGIHFDERRDSFHDCGGLCPNGHGYWVYPDHIKTLDPKARETPPHTPLTREQYEVLKVGDRVKYVHTDCEATVAFRLEGFSRDGFGVKLDEPCGHDCRGRIEVDYGFNLWEDELDQWVLCSPPPSLKEQLRTLWEPLLCP